MNYARVDPAGLAEALASVARRLHRWATAVTLASGVLLILAGSAGADPLLTAAPYEVLPDDTVSSIAARFGIDIDTVVRANHLTSADLIKPGQILSILPVSGLAYTVQLGDTVTGIAARNAVDVAAILQWNDIADPNHIVIGSDLVLPGAQPPAPRPQVTASAPARLAPASLAPVDPEQESESEPGRSFAAKITAYAPGGGATNATTRSGTLVRWGVIAVDPSVVPLGSSVRIEGFEDTFVAEDTGSAIRGAHVEIFYPDLGSAVRFGVQTRKVTVLD
ncbi:MAG: LysM peptidoglycan-binding domain-containing protein [Chloroflexi bacterium]|nr:LysM peptidoglycan-binding domain-containing protein [Chloroflexota bacterium]